MNVINIDRTAMTVDGVPVTEREMIVLANKIYGNRERYTQLPSDPGSGKYTYEEGYHAVDE